MSNISDVIKSVAPAIATALGGPLAGAAVAFLSNKFGVPAEQVAQTIAGMSPADMVKLKQIDAEFQEEMGKQGIAISLAQIDVNREEAKSTNWFVAGWRPYIGWVCGTGLAYQFLFMPILNGALTAGGFTPPFVALDVATLTSCLSGLLGLGAMRTWEKHNNVEGNR